MKLSDNDLAVMNIIWEEKRVPAVVIAEKICQQLGWKKPAVYTLLDRLIKKGAVSREDPDYICTALIKKEEVMVKETEGLIKRLYNGSAKLLISGFIKDNRLSADDIRELKELIDSYDGEE